MRHRTTASCHFLPVKSTKNIIDRHPLVNTFIFPTDYLQVRLGALESWQSKKRILLKPVSCFLLQWISNRHVKSTYLELSEMNFARWDISKFCSSSGRSLIPAVAYETILLSHSIRQSLNTSYQNEQLRVGVALLWDVLRDKIEKRGNVLADLVGVSLEAVRWIVAIPPNIDHFVILVNCLPCQPWRYGLHQGLLISVQHRVDVQQRPRVVRPWAVWPRVEVGTAAAASRINHRSKIGLVIGGGGPQNAWTCARIKRLKSSLTLTIGGYEHSQTIRTCQIGSNEVGVISLGQALTMTSWQRLQPTLSKHMVHEYGWKWKLIEQVLRLENFTLCQMSIVDANVK